MKKITALIMMALLMTIGGVYATWNYSEGNATASSPRDSVNIALTTANDVGSNGTFSFSNSIELGIDDSEDDDVVHKAVLICDGSVVITFKPETTASGEIKTLGIPMQVATTYTPVQYNGVDIVTIKSSFLSPVLTTGNTVADAADTAEANDLGIVRKETNGTFTWTLSSADVLSLFTLYNNQELILDSRSDYDDVAALLSGHKVVQFTVSQVTA
ncbi:MAG: hypothetical protein IKV61_03630 [Clostridia bacterium]|nr:hypothetical protein [Clostridia bacterium]